MSSEWNLGDDFHMGEGHSCTPFLRIEDHPKKLNPNAGLSPFIENVGNAVFSTSYILLDNFQLTDYL